MRSRLFPTGLALFWGLAALSGCDDAAPIEPPPPPPPEVVEEFDVFVVAGQSNAEGWGDSTGSPPIPAGVAFLYESGTLRPLRGDPVGDATTGSAWPAFIRNYHILTERGVVIVEAAAYSSAATPAAQPDRHWGRGGGLFEAAERLGEAAYQAALADGMRVRRGGWLWCQGERDGRAIDNGLITAADYEAAMRDLLARYSATSFGTAEAPFFVLKTGRESTGDTPGFAAVRAIQGDLPPPVRIAYPYAVSFPERGLMADRIHWGQEGLNEAGAAAAVEAAAASEPE